MNLKIVLRSLGILLICEAIALLPPTFVALLYQDGDLPAFLITIGMVLTVGMLLAFIKPSCKNIYARDGFAIVALGWLLMSFFGAFPFYISGAFPSFVDSFFESSSGLTTTGSSVLTAVEGLPHGILFWRSFTHWIGGMGILVLTIAILPSLGTGSMQVMKAESPGPIVGRIVPKLGQTAKILYGIYLGMTLLEVVILWIAGMNLFDSFIHALGTVGTGGFSNMNASVGYYNSPLIDWIITIFMILCGVNFSLYYFILKGNFKSFFKNNELRTYLCILFGVILLITFDLMRQGTYSSFGEAFRFSSFQSASVMTTTGYATTDFNEWSLFSKMLLLLLMFIGGCAGSTAGGLKVSRAIIGMKSIKYSVKQIIHPNGYYSVRMDDKKIEDKTVSSVLSYFFVYIVVFTLSILLIALDGFDFTTTVTSVITALNNIGPGLGLVGPTGNFSAFSDFSKVVFSILMIIGRLEIYPILLLLTPDLWKKS